MIRLSQRVGYWSAGLALVLVFTLLGLSGRGLPAVGTQLLNGEAWLGNVLNSSVSLIDGYSGKVSSQVGLPGMAGHLQVVNTPNGAVVSDPYGRLMKVSNDNFTTAGPIRLFGGALTTAAAGGSALYAVDESAGEIQQLSDSGPRLEPIGPRISVGASVSSPVVAPDGSLYVAIRSSGRIGHVAGGRLVTIAGAGQRSDDLAVVTAGTLPVAIDLTRGTMVRLGAGKVIGRTIHLPAGFKADQVTGSDTTAGLVGLVGSGAVVAVDTLTGTASTTRLPFPVTASAAALRGRLMVLIDSARRRVLVVNTATRRLLRQVTFPKRQVPDQLTVKDRLVFVNNSEGAQALVINGAGGVHRVTKYTSPPPVKHSKPTLPIKAPARPGRYHGPPRPPGAPQNPVATPGNASVALGWGAATANGSAIRAYLVTWQGRNGAVGHTQVTGSSLGTTIRGLSNGISYTFTVTAVNGIGRGPAARASPVTPSSSVPGAPSGLSASATMPDGSVTLRWTAADNGYHIASYTIWVVGTSVPLVTKVTSTSTTVPASQGLTAGTPVQFQVSAVGTAGASGAKSAPSAPVTPFLPPGAPVATLAPLPAAGTSATLSVSCPAACQNGRPPASYQVTVSPGGTPFTTPAAAGGAATNVPVTGLSPNTPYTAAVTVIDTAHVSGTADTPVQIATPGPPSVSGVTMSANGTSLTVTATVNPGGLTTTCQVSVSGGPTVPGSCSSISVNVSTYNMSYNVTFTATNPDGPASGNTSGKSGLKPLTANATDAFGPCGNPPKKYCGGNSHLEPSANFVAGNGAPEVYAGTPESAACWTTGGTDLGNVPPYTGGSNQWVYLQAGGYMSILWFPTPDSVTQNLPHC
jgi:Fibronectin type III domain